MHNVEMQNEKEHDGQSFALRGDVDIWLLTDELYRNPLDNVVEHLQEGHFIYTSVNHLEVDSSRWHQSGDRVIVSTSFEFEDVPEGEDYQHYVKWHLERGLSSRYPEMIELETINVQRIEGFYWG